MSAYNVTVDMPNLPRGEEVEISGLGCFKNGSTTEVTKEQAEAFRVFHQQVSFEQDPETKALRTVTTIGPTVLQANIPGVKVETVKVEPESKTETTSTTTTNTKEGDK